MDLPEKIKLRAYLATSKYISRATLFEANLEGIGRPFRCLLVDNSSLTEYLLAKGHLNSPRVLKRWKILLPSLSRHVSGIRDHLDLCITVFSKPDGVALPGGFSFKARGHVRQILDLSGTRESLERLNHKSKKTLQLIRKNGFSSRVSVQAKDFDFFYHRMYLPHVLKQHGPYASIDEYEDMRAYFLQGFLMMALDQGRTVSAQLCHIRGDTLILRRAGVLDGDGIHVKKGVQSAVYYFMIRFARENGLRKIDFMNSRPFFEDGVYYHKARWGASVQPEDSESWIHFLVPRLSESVVQFFQRNPVIIQTPQGTAGLVGRTGSAGISPEEETDLKNKYYAPGLSHLLLMKSAPFEFKALPFSTAQYLSLNAIPSVPFSKNMTPGSGQA